MHTVVGIFGSRAAAEPAVRRLPASGVPEQSIIFLTADQPESKMASMRTTDAEAEGMGKAMGAYLRDVVGASAGLSLGSAAASLFVPDHGCRHRSGGGASEWAARAEPPSVTRQKTRWLKAFLKTMSSSIATC